jgi:hypothetical protein
MTMSTIDELLSDIIDDFDAMVPEYQKECRDKIKGFVNAQFQDLAKSFTNSADKKYTGQQVHQVIEKRVTENEPT